jgi:hypothetical protein
VGGSELCQQHVRESQGAVETLARQLAEPSRWLLSVPKKDDGFLGVNRGGSDRRQHEPKGHSHQESTHCLPLRPTPQVGECRTWDFLLLEMSKSGFKRGGFRHCAMHGGKLDFGGTRTAR